VFLHLHGVKIAEAIGRGLKVPVVSKSPEEAGKHFGWLGSSWAPTFPCPAHSRRNCWDGAQQGLGSLRI